MKWTAALLLWTLHVPVIHAADWIRITSANFELLSDAPEGVARKTLATFEQARDFFRREQPTLAGSPPPATIVGFNDPSEYKPYSIKGGADLAYYLPGAQSDYIVISDLGFDRMRVALHEYLHLIVSHSRLSIPLWLNEGMAEVYSTLEERDGKLVLGEMKRDRVLELANGNWMHLPALLRADENSPLYNEQNLEGMFYAESCVLAHMLMLADGYADKFPRFLERVSATGSTQTAFAEVYNKPASEIEKELKVYFFQSVKGGAVYRTAPAGVEIGDPRPATAPEVGATLADLKLRLGRTGEARMRLQELASLYPHNAGIEAALASVEEQRDDKEAALVHYRAALATGSAGWMVYWNYARLLDDQGGEIPPRLQALEDALQRKPDLTEARLRLANGLCAAHRYSEALERLQQAPRVDPERAVAVFGQMAVAAFGMNRFDDARRYADEARLAARTPDEKAAVDLLFAQIQRAGPASSNPDGSPPAPDPDRPTLRHKPAPPAPPKKGGALFRPAPPLTSDFR